MAASLWKARCLCVTRAAHALQGLRNYTHQMCFRTSAESFPTQVLKFATSIIVCLGAKAMLSLRSRLQRPGPYTPSTNRVPLFTVQASPTAPASASQQRRQGDTYVVSEEEKQFFKVWVVQHSR